MIGSHPYAGGRVSTVAGVGGERFIFLVQANPSIEEAHYIEKVTGVYQNALANVAGSHDYTLTDPGNGSVRKILNGAKLVRGQDSRGSDFITLDDSSKPSGMIDQYFGANGMFTPGTLAAPNTDPSAAAVDATLLGGTPNTNFMMFLCARAANGEDVNALKTVGFDIGGYRAATVASSITEWGASMTIGDNNKGSGVLSSITAPNTWVGMWDNISNFSSITNDCIIAKCIAVNGAAGKSVLGQMNYDGEYLRQVESTLAWTGASGTPWVGKSPRQVISLNVGEACLSGTGVFHMGIINYSTTIPDHELYRVMDFMCRTGQLPPWWGVK